MLIRGADIYGNGYSDLRISNGVVAAIGQLESQAGERVIEARGGALLPGLHDHHIHLAALAAKASSVACGPPAVNNAAELEEALLAAPGKGWLRGIGYHESVMDGLPDAAALDAIAPHRPLRIQHRSGRMWLLNTMAMEALIAAAPPPAGMERLGSGFTGRLFDEDGWLQEALGSTPPDFGVASAALVRFGITGFTDMSVRNDPVIAAHFAAQRRAGALRQRCILAGSLALANAPDDTWHLGPAKLHLHEANLPPFEDAVRFIEAAHEQGRPVAVHCVSEVELVFALAALAEAGTRPGDRIEHVSVASLKLVEQMAQLGLSGCVQPQFVAERGDRYLLDVEARHQGDLYRLHSLTSFGIPIAGGSDAPYGSADPWLAMAAAVSRRTSSGAVVGADEAIGPDEALRLYLSDPLDFTRSRSISVGAPADLCLLARPWAKARVQLSSDHVVATLVAGEVVHHRVDESPIMSHTGTDATSTQHH
ncbi:amidohydrolase family protein [Novosphingobium sp. M1R2S20]|uniref:Amidohydrolase family protein n=1 Tax=Novosphingobium rhizovicinum TaxID=3228928 RepID=A0ABV3R8C8_9SPHN